ncbi:MAG: DUF5655 domain-containing protein [Methanobrevibacter sp.]|nr:DUF5655 domain-containing protein [Methanobrevibacter sp.]
MAKEIKFKKEYYLHMFTQKHLKELFGLKCVASEIQKKRLRFDNLAFDCNTNSFVIIEYKNKLCKSVLEQVQEYRDLIQEDENQKYFISRLEKEINVDFDKTKIMIIGPDFSQEQIDEAEEDLEFWKVTLFNDCKVTYENLHTNETKTLPITLDDLKITEDMLLENRSAEMKYLYLNLKNNILNEFSDVEIKYLVNKFSFRVNDKIICVIAFQKHSLEIYIYADNLENAERTNDISQTDGNDNYKLKYKSNDDFDYFLDLFKQTYYQKGGKDE